MNSSCSTDNADFNTYNIEGKWRLEGIYNYDLKSRLYESTFYDQVWNVTSDTIEFITTYHLGEGFGNGILKQKLNYSIFPNGAFLLGSSRKKIKKLTDKEFTFSVKRPDHTTDYRYFSIN